MTPADRTYGWRRAVAVAVLLIAGLAQADDGPRWAELDAEQQEVLARFADDWERIAPERRKRLVQFAARWSEMTPEEQERARERLDNWRALSDDRRGRIRDKLQTFQELPPEEQQRIRRQFREFQSLNRERREALRERWQTMTPEERDAVLERLRERRPPPQGSDDKRR